MAFATVGLWTGTVCAGTLLTSVSKSKSLTVLSLSVLGQIGLGFRTSLFWTHFQTSSGSTHYCGLGYVANTFAYTQVHKQESLYLKNFYTKFHSTPLASHVTRDVVHVRFGYACPYTSKYYT